MRVGTPHAYPQPRGLSVIWTAANAVTLARLALVPVVVGLVLAANFAAALWVFLAAGASDAADGWLARRAGPSRMGAILDPAADKVLMAASYLCLAAMGAVPIWLAALVIGRDVVIVAGVVLAAARGRPFAIRPLAISKANTALQIVYVTSVLADRGYWLGLGTAVAALAILVAATTLASGALSVWHGVRQR